MGCLLKPYPFFYFFVLMLSLSACNNPGQNTGDPNGGRKGGSNDSTYTLTGRLLGLDSGWVYLLNRETDSMNPVPDSARISQGIFTFRGVAPTPQFMLLGIRGIAGDNRIAYQLGFFVDRGVTSLAGSKDSLYQAVVTGSPAQDEYLAYPKTMAPFQTGQKSLDSIFRIAKAAHNEPLLDSLQDASLALEQSIKQAVKAYTISHPASAVGAFQALEYFSYGPDPGPLDSIYNNLAPAIQNSWLGQKLKSTANIARKTAIGQPAPEFSQNDAGDHPVALASFRGKYVLVDFWASWCGPCRGESPRLVKAYNRFHPKGFEIFSVSLDDNKAAWLDAVKKDQLAWTHVCDLKGWQNGVAKLYGISAIPMNFLLDRQGTIVAKSLRGGQLDKKLAQLLP